MNVILNKTYDIRGLSPEEVSAIIAALRHSATLAKNTPLAEALKDLADRIEEAV
jgi:GH15 family glucan-1,4-alpha-glucosidase